MWKWTVVWNEVKQRDNKCVSIHTIQNSKMIMVTGRKLVVPLKTCHYVIDNSIECHIVVCREVDGIISIRLILVGPKGSKNGVFDRPYHIVLYIIVFDKTRKIIKNIFPTSLLHTCP